MKKTFKRTLTAAAVAAAAISGSANAAIELAGPAVQLYGQAAANYQFWSADGAGKEDTAVVEIESRIGLRGTVEFEDFGPDFVWQMETGNAANGGGNDKGQGALGGRDTFVGFAFDGLGSLKYGRQLVAAYNYVDWPHSNPGLGNVFDWHNTLGWNDTDKEIGGFGFEDRANNVLRFDSESFDGFSFQATLSGMDKTTDAAVVSVAAAYAGDGFGVHAAHYTQGEYTVDTAKKGDVSYSIVGGNVSAGPVTFTAAYKMMENGYQQIDAAGTTQSNSQDAISVTAALSQDAWLYKLGYAQTFESDKGNNDESTAITARVLRSLQSAALYFDVRDYDMLGSDKAADGTRFMFGAEYYF